MENFKSVLGVVAICVLAAIAFAIPGEVEQPQRLDRDLLFEIRTERTKTPPPAISAWGMGMGGRIATCYVRYVPPKWTGCVPAERGFGLGRLGHYGSRGKSVKREPTPEPPIEVVANLGERTPMVPGVVTITEPKKSCGANDDRAECRRRRQLIVQKFKNHRTSFEACYRQPPNRDFVVSAKLKIDAGSFEQIAIFTDENRACWKNVVRRWSAPQFDSPTDVDVSVYFRNL